ncbi:MAG: cell division protein FtsQ [Burkholderiaceae bacterium]|nr:cell division protein FtsQ [Burkholderiaceae bacterium]
MTKPYIPPEAGLKPITDRDRKASPLAGACFALFIVIGLFSTLYATSFGKLNLFPKGIAWSPFLQGDVSQAFALALADAPVPSSAARVERGVSWVVAGDLGPRVRRGAPGWLFLGDELTVHRQPQRNATQRKVDVLKVQKTLSAKGIKLLVVVVPDKTRIEASQLGMLHRPSRYAQRASQWVTDLNSSGIDALDLTDTLAAFKQKHTAAFLKSDSHWTEQGAQAAAIAVSAEVLRLKITPSPAQTWVVDKRIDSRRSGDLIRLAGVDWLPTGLQPEQDIAQETSFKVDNRKNNAPGFSAQSVVSTSTDDLFGDTDLPNIVVIGTSYSRTSNFVAFIEKELNAKVANLARSGGDFSGAMNAYLSSVAFKKTPPKLVIWEIPERVLQQSASKDSIQ